MSGRAAVLGRPIGHSLSPVLHAAAYAALGLDLTYTAIDCDEAGLPAMIARVRSEPGWVGLSLTMPLKIAILRLLDETDEAALTLGAVNTVVVQRPAGLPVGLRGFNTDTAGVILAVERVLGSGVKPVRPVVLGAGGTARAALGALAGLGASQARLIARRPAAAAPLVDLGARLGITVHVHPWDDANHSLRGDHPWREADHPWHDADIVVATAPAGATDAFATLPWPADAALVESLYDPWPTPLAAAALGAGAPVAGGLVVLAGQAVGQVGLFTGEHVDVEVLLAAGRAALAAR